MSIFVQALIDLYGAYLYSRNVTQNQCPMFNNLGSEEIICKYNRNECDIAKARNELMCPQITMKIQWWAGYEDRSFHVLPVLLLLELLSQHRH